MDPTVIDPGGELAATDAPQVTARAADLLLAHQSEIWRRTDRLFLGLLILQWVGGIVFAFCFSPRTWEGAASHIHPHVWESIFLGLVILVSPFCFVAFRPGRSMTRHIIAVAQMLSSALLIHLSGGRIETHFHVFGSLAFLAFYRDWRVLITGTVIVAADHLLRGYFVPESVYGIRDASQWRWAEHAAWVVFEDIFLLSACFQSVKEMRLIAERRAQLEHSYRLVEDKVQERTRQLKAAQEDLVRIARSAGMAEIATSVLHNVGNVLNSLNVSLRVATDRIQQSPVRDLASAVNMLVEHKADVGEFLNADARGRQLPGFLEAVADVMKTEQSALLEEMNSLGKNVEHIKQIVAVQQSHAKAAGVIEPVAVAEAVEDALRVNVLSGDRYAIKVIREFAAVPPVHTDKHALLQILINLCSNAKHALQGCDRPDKTLTLRILGETRDGCETVRIQVADNGVGIAPQNLTRIFNHGFTTKKDGHGFGLHSAANSARQLGGALTAHSDGPGRGAVFTLELPIQTEVAAV